MARRNPVLKQCKGGFCLDYSVHALSMHSVLNGLSETGLMSCVDILDNNDVSDVAIVSYSVFDTSVTQGWIGHEGHMSLCLSPDLIKRG